MGLFVTGTDTGVGKTVVACAIASALRRQLGSAGRSGVASDGGIGVCKPFSSGCRRDREGLVSEDAEALAHFADCRRPLDVINPVRFSHPLAPAVAAEQTGQRIDWPALKRSLDELDRSSDIILIEGVGGVMVPLDPLEPKLVVLDLIRAIGYPAVVVCRSGLGTLNHTAMTVRLLKQGGCRVAGLVMNMYDADALADATDPSIATNRQWLEKLTGCKVLAVCPKVKTDHIRPHKGMIDAAVLDAVAMTWWDDRLGGGMAQ